MKKLMLLMVALVSLCGTQRASSLTIIRDFSQMGTAPTNSSGTGDAIAIINAVCDWYEKIFLDSHTIIIHFKWAPVGGGQHVLITQGGTPNRETEAEVSFNNDNNPLHFSWYFTPDPLTCSEATGYTEESVDLGGGMINATKCYTWATTNRQMDFYTGSKHETGHALGLAFANTTFIFESLDGDIDILSGVYAGMTVPLQHNNAGVVSHIDYVASRPLMTGSWAPGERVMLSDLDIVTLAWLCGFTQINLNQLPELEISTPYQVAGITKVDLSWTPVVPAPTGMHYAVQTCTDLQSNCWTTLTYPVTSAVGSGSSMTVTATNAQAFFRLIVETNTVVGVGSLRHTLPAPSLKDKAVRCIDPDGDAH